MTVENWFQRMEYELSLRLVSGSGGLRRELTSSQVTRPGLALAGYYNHFASERIQVLGQAEMAFLADRAPDERQAIIRRLFSHEIPCLVVTKSQDIPPELIAESEESGTPLFLTKMLTATFIARAIVFLEEEFGAFEVVHANLAEVYGVGVLIRGKSGIGKSECTLELVRRGHRFVADDSVLVKHVTGHRIIGTAAHPLKHFMEVRGVGIIDVVTLFGITSIRTHKRVSMVVTLEEWDTARDFQRTGLERQEFDLLGEMLPHATIPVHPGRNPAIVIEVATMDFLARRMGRFAAQEFDKALLSEMEEAKPRLSLPTDDWDDQLDF